MIHHKLTVWFDDRGNPIQVAVMMLCDWEARSEATESVGPFETLDEATQRAYDAARNLLDKQISGQLRLY